jgi:hypothetical protein
MRNKKKKLEHFHNIIIRLNNQLYLSRKPAKLALCIKFEGDTLVFDVTDQMPDTWIDHAGNHPTDALRVTERYTHMSPNGLMYEATLEDTNVYTRPWTIRLPLYRRLDTNMQLLEFKCVEFAEELMYGHLRKGAESP